MNKTKEDYSQFDHIPGDRILKDINDTLAEIPTFEKIRDNAITVIYDRQVFIAKLRNIIDYRKGESNESKDKK